MIVVYIKLSIIFREGQTWNSAGCTEIDDDDTILACQNGIVFTFVPHGEQWNPSVSSADQTCIDVGSGENLVGQKLSKSSTGIVHHIM